MQSVCLDEFGGEKMVPPRSRETTLVQYIFGGLLQSQVQCTVCNNVSEQYENMMDLTVEIHGDAVSLEECLDQFTAKEWLQGDNMYKCDRYFNKDPKSLITCCCVCFLNLIICQSFPGVVTM